MQRKKLLWQLYPSQLLITMLTILVLMLYAANTLGDFYRAHTIRDLENRLELTLPRIYEPFEQGRYEQLNLICQEIGRQTATRYTIILRSGVVIADSEQDPALMGNHAERIEIKVALQGQPGSAVRFSQTSLQEMLYVARPLKLNNEVKGIFRAAIPLTSFDVALRSFYGRILFGSLIIAFLTALVTLEFSRRITHPIEKIKRGINRFANGDFSRKLVFTEQEPVSLEVMHLAETINNMGEQLSRQLMTVTRQHQELEAVFASMIEAVLVLDAETRLLSINRAAAKLLEVEQATIKGREVTEVITNPVLLQFVRKALASYQTIEEEIVLTGGDDGARHLQAHGTMLLDEQRKKTGSLIVLHDITRLRRLEQVRQDFVANVSHELKTPITAIKGFVETLLDGAMNDPADAGRFLEITRKQADRLNAIVDDLLILSRLDNEAKNKTITLSRQGLKEILQTAIETCTIKAAAKNISVELQCPDHLSAWLNAPLFEQTVINLVVNAVKYSDPGSKIEVEARQTPKEVLVMVRDNGCGIGQEHLPRLFERFYRSDKDRSRKLGGTGLGLAIVKHICQIHNGKVTVASEIGAGTTFTIHLPQGN